MFRALPIRRVSIHNFRAHLLLPNSVLRIVVYTMYHGCTADMLVAVHEIHTVSLQLQAIARDWSDGIDQLLRPWQLETGTP